LIVLYIYTVTCGTVILRYRFSSDSVFGHAPAAVAIYALTVCATMVTHQAARNWTAR